MTIQEEIEQLKKETETLRKENEVTKGEIWAMLKSGQKDWDEVKRQQSNTQKTIEDVGKQLGGIGNSNGAYAEEVFFSSLFKLKKLGGIKFDAVDKNVHFSKKGIHDEFDIVMVNGDSIALIEVKYKATKEHLKTLIEKKLDSFKKLFPEFKNHKFYLGLAGLSFESKAFEKEVLKKGVALLKAVGDHTEVFADNLKVY